MIMKKLESIHHLLEEIQNVWFREQLLLFVYVLCQGAVNMSN